MNISSSLRPCCVPPAIGFPVANTNREIDESTDKPRYYIDLDRAVRKIKARLMAVKQVVDADSDPMEEEVFKCRSCGCPASLSRVRFPDDPEGFSCPKCLNTLELAAVPQSTDGSSETASLRDDLHHFFSLLRPADQACATRLRENAA